MPTGILAELRSWSPRALLALCAAAVVGVVVVAGQLAGRSDASIGAVGSMAVLAALFTAMGLLIVVNLRGHVVGLLMAAAGGIATVTVVAISWATWEPLAWLSQWAWWPPFALVFLSLLVFPDGRPPSRRWWGLAAVMAVLAVLVTVCLAVAALDHPRTLLTDVTEFTPQARQLVRIAAIGALLTLGCLVLVSWSLWRRWRAASGDERAQLACLLPGAVLLLIGIALDTLGIPGAWALSVLALPVAMTVAVLRHRLWDLDQVVDRTLVWLIMTLLVIVGFVVLVTVLRSALTDLEDSGASLAATGVIAVAFDPLRRRVQHGVDRLVYGDRNDPYTFIATIGGVTESTNRPDAVLPSLTAAVASSMQVPYVAVELPGPDGVRVVAEHGRVTASLEGFDMMAHGESVGRLLVGPRARRGPFSPAERRLFESAALHAAVAAEATRLIVDLRDSRESLVLAREEERRRLRHDLHDGVGPTLAGMAMQLSAARRLVTGQERAERILGGLADDLQTCNAEMRQLVDELRPPDLDKGLAAAIRKVCQRFDGPQLSVGLELELAPGPLPAAVEVAAYRILGEALTNVARHSGARTCRVRVRHAESLTMTVTDDGTGIQPSARRGEGLDSMRMRTSELGGVITFSSLSGGGTAVHVTLPLPPAVDDGELAMSDVASPSAE
jgi:signal transduction histidine kinase